MCVQRCKDLLPRLPRVVSVFKAGCPSPPKPCRKGSLLLPDFHLDPDLAKVLRLLANTYLDWDWPWYQDKALKTLNLAKEAPRFSYLHMCLLARDSVGFDFLKTVCDRFESSADVGKGFLLHVKLLLQRKEDQLAKKKVEDILTAHHAGKELPPQILSWLHTILWDRAAQNFEAQNYFEALQWYNYSLNFYPSGQMDADFAKLQRNRASCYIHLKQLEKANAAVKEAERFDAANIFTQFIIFKIAVLRDNTEEALTAVDALEKSVGNSAAQEKEMVKEENSSTAFLTFAAQFALENGQQDVARRALEYLSQHSQDLQQVLTALKVFIIHLCSTYFPQLSQLCPSEKTVLTSQKACLLMVAAADLELGRSASEASQQTELLSRALEHIQGCKEISNVLKLAGDGSKDPTENLLLLYEIEARAKLHDAGLTSLLESVWELPQLETKILETIASVAMEHPAHYPDIAKKALRKALSLYLQGESIDVAKFSKCLHSFINLSLPDEALSTDVCSLQDIWSTFEVALRVISHSVKYPQVEILWLMTKAWNTGVSQYKEGMYIRACPPMKNRAARTWNEERYSGAVSRSVLGSS
uniref:Protein ZIP4 homolog n=1 Tax=Monodelphis domestica TaxID=13616 RepID=A0A5F8GQH0_MONDO